MNKTDRLLAIVLELQRNGRQRAEDLAKIFETSKRTIYRDILALCEAGVPIISVPGQGYSLMKGYFLPPLSFTSEEAALLLLGSDFLARNFDTQYRVAAESAIRKIENVLPEALRNEVQYLQSNIRFVGTTPPSNPKELETLQHLRQAVLEHLTVRFCYHTRHCRDEQNSSLLREVDPYGLAYFINGWHLIAYCHLRGDIRNFRLDRMEGLELLSRTFTRPDTVQLHPCPREQSRNMLVRVLFDRDIVRWVREGHHYYVISEEETEDGLLVTLMIRQPDEILQWLLSWGRHVRILEPDTLRDQLADEARTMLQQYQRVSSPLK